MQMGRMSNSGGIGLQVTFEKDLQDVEEIKCRIISRSFRRGFSKMKVLACHSSPGTDADIFLGVSCFLFICGIHE